MSPVNYKCFILPKEALSAFLDYQEKWSLSLYLLLTDENRFEVKSVASMEIACEDISRQILALRTFLIKQEIIIILTINHIWVYYKSLIIRAISDKR